MTLALLICDCYAAIQVKFPQPQYVISCRFLLQQREPNFELFSDILFAGCRKTELLIEKLESLRGKIEHPEPREIVTKNIFSGSEKGLPDLIYS
ncbi:MAG: hypothetical protein ACJAXN_000038 [Psychromonas sp.]|jgi:hypothetical protein